MRPIIINGYSQEGSPENNNSFEQGSNAIPGIIINGDLLDQQEFRISHLVDTPSETPNHPAELVSVVLGLTTTRRCLNTTRPSENVSRWPARSRGRITPRYVSVSAQCRLNSPLPLDRHVFPWARVVFKRAFHRRKAGGGQFRVWQLDSPPTSRRLERV